MRGEGVLEDIERGGEGGTLEDIEKVGDLQDMTLTFGMTYAPIPGECCRSSMALP